MGKDVWIFIAEPVEAGAGCQECESGFGQLQPIFAPQQRFQPVPERMQI